MKGIEPHRHTGSFKNECKKTKSENQICVAWLRFLSKTANFHPRPAKWRAHTGATCCILGKGASRCLERGCSGERPFSSVTEFRGRKGNMRTIRNSFGSLAIIGGLIGSLNIIHAQTTAKAIQAVSVDDMAVVLQAIEETTPVAAESVPRYGLFYSAQMPMGPPLPGSMGWSARNSWWRRLALRHHPL